MLSAAIVPTPLSLIHVLPQLQPLHGQHRLARRLARQARRKQARTALIEERDVTAWHEAAHAVVGVRLEMELYSVDIIPTPLRDAAGNVAGVSCGFTSYLVSGLAERLGKENALRARAVFAAAGIVAEQVHGDGNPTAILDDSRGVLRFAAALGISEREFPAFADSVRDEAEALLLVDRGVAWHRVRTALHHRQKLTPAQVVELIGAARGG